MTYDKPFIEDWKLKLGQRLRRAIEKRYGRRSECRFAKDIQISQGSLSDILNGRSQPCALTLLKISEKTTISVKYLLRGK